MVQLEYIQYRPTRSTTVNRASRIVSALMTPTWSNHSNGCGHLKIRPVNLQLAGMPTDAAISYCLFTLPDLFLVIKDLIQSASSFTKLVNCEASLRVMEAFSWSPK